MLGALEALECGTTAIVDHHESPDRHRGQPRRDRRRVRRGRRAGRVRLRRHRPPRRRRRQARAGRERAVPPCRGTRAGRRPRRVHVQRRDARGGRRPRRDLGVGVHIHVAEGSVDADAGKRLAALADDVWLLVHGVHLDRDLPGTIAHNPRSNMNNAVGYARPARVRTRSCSAPTASAPTCSRSSASRSCVCARTT